MKTDISWQEYENYMISLAKKIKADYEINNFDQIICLARGGVPLGDALSRMLKLPLAILFTSSYKLQEKQSNIYIDNQIAKQNNVLGTRILLVDDLVDSGETFKFVFEHLKNHSNINYIKTATIWAKETSIYIPDYYLNTTKQDDWINQPFEKFDDLII